MKYYHLYDDNSGIKLGFLGIAKNFDEADAMADKLVADSKIISSIWIMDEEAVQGLLNSITKEFPDMKPITVDMRVRSRLPTKFIEERLPIADTMKMMGMPVKDLDEDSLKATIVCGFQTVENQRKHHAKSLELMVALGKAQNGK